MNATATPTPNPNPYDTLPDAVTDVFGPDATAEQAYDLLTVDVSADAWITALTTARDQLGCTFFDWLSAVDEPGVGFRICAHVAALEGGRVRRLLVRTTVPHDAAVLPTAVDVYAGAAWHERETYEMFGVTFTDHPNLVHLLLPENFEGHPLRKDFVLAARVAKAWPGAKEPGESEHGGPKRRQMLPPGVPDPNEWGPLKGQLPPAPERPARAARAAGDRPVRRARTAGEGSASQAAETPAAEGAAPPARRARTAAGGSASQTSEGSAAPARRSRTAADGSASQAAPAADGTADAAGTTPASPAGPGRSRSASRRDADAPAASEAPAPAAEPAAAAPRTRSSDAPWHHARPAFDEPAGKPKPDAAGAPTPTPGAEPAAAPPTPDSAPSAAPAPEAKQAPDTDAAPEPTPETPAAPAAEPTPEAAPAPDAAPVAPAAEPEAEPAPAPEPAPEPDADEPPSTTPPPAGGEPA